jgi:glycerol uptake facilitator-like aquaporin
MLTYNEARDIGIDRVEKYVPVKKKKNNESHWLYFLLGFFAG